jgi:hypothetical protein
VSPGQQGGAVQRCGEPGAEIALQSLALWNGATLQLNTAYVDGRAKLPAPRKVSSPFEPTCPFSLPQRDWVSTSLPQPEPSFPDWERSPAAILARPLLHHAGGGGRGRSNDRTSRIGRCGRLGSEWLASARPGGCG